MESLYHFSPLWERPEFVSKPEQAIEELRIKSLEAFLHRNHSEAAKPLTLNGTFLFSTKLIMILKLLSRRRTGMHFCHSAAPQESLRWKWNYSKTPQPWPRWSYGCCEKCFGTLVCRVKPNFLSRLATRTFRRLGITERWWSTNTGLESSFLLRATRNRKSGLDVNAHDIWSLVIAKTRKTEISVLDINCFYYNFVCLLLDMHGSSVQTMGQGRFFRSELWSNGTIHQIIMAGCSSKLWYIRQSTWEGIWCNIKRGQTQWWWQAFLG